MKYVNNEKDEENEKPLVNNDNTDDKASNTKK